MSVFYAPGEYLCEVIDQGIAEAKTGTLQFFVKTKIVGRIDRSQPEPQLIAVQANYERTLFRPITKDTHERFIADMRALGFDGDDFNDLTHDGAHFWDLTGRQYPMVCSHQEYQGQMRERWDFALGGSFTPKAPERKRVMELNALFGKALKAAPKTSKPSEAPSSAPAQAPAQAPTQSPAQALESTTTDDDNLPF